MLINPRKVLKEWLKGVPDKHVQPNAIDVPVIALYKINPESPFFLLQDSKIHKKRVELLAVHSFPETKELEHKTFWKLESGAYDYVSSAYVEVPEKVAGWIITRSTLNRNGVFVVSGLYDSGFKGHVNGTIYVVGGTTYIEPGSCIGQFIVVDSDSEGLYAGGYNTAEGELPKQIQNN